MTAQEYISSGMLELYVLGALSSEEMTEVQNAVAHYPEVMEELTRIENDLLKYAELHKIAPDSGLKEWIVDEAVNKPGKIIPVEIKRSSKWRDLSIAASVVLAISLAINMYQNFSSDKIEDNYAHLLVETGMSQHKADSLKQALQNKESEIKSITAELALIRDPNTQIVTLNSMVEGHPMKAMVHWNMKTMEAAIDPMTLPKTDSLQHYVLWVVVDGKAVNGGSFDVSNEFDPMLMVNIPKAEAFAISLEKDVTVNTHEGPIYVMGKPVTAP